EIVASREQGKVAHFSEHEIASEARGYRDDGAAVHQRWAEVDSRIVEWDGDEPTLPATGKHTAEAPAGPAGAGVNRQQNVLALQAVAQTWPNDAGARDTHVLEHAVAVDEDVEVRIAFERAIDGIDVHEGKQPRVHLGIRAVSLGDRLVEAHEFERRLVPAIDPDLQPGDHLLLLVDRVDESGTIRQRQVVAFVDDLLCQEWQLVVPHPRCILALLTRAL